MHVAGLGSVPGIPEPSGSGSELRASALGTSGCDCVTFLTYPLSAGRAAWAAGRGAAAVSEGPPSGWPARCTACSVAAPFPRLGLGAPRGAQG